MSYTVLARRYRSRTFDELIGQEAIGTTLKNAIKTGRVAHAYLFTGTRGVGKTSCARILAKALNCVKGPTPVPCCECDICQDIARGEDVDVIEIDGASNTSVDDIRQLRANAIFRPARARYKIYIIDEVHMISTGAFNALLKTLEEPPEYVKFVFATTEPNKVPITIQSRCQRFDFRPIPKAKIAEHIKWILEQEKIEAEDVVVERIAQLANGSMRDALSLLDQLLSVGNKKLTSKLVEQFLPIPPVDRYAELVDTFIGKDPAGAVRKVESILSEGTSPAEFCSDLIEYLRDVMIASASGENVKKLLSAPESAHRLIYAQASKLPPISWSYAITIVEELSRSVRFSDHPRPLIDAAMVTLTSLSDLIDITSADVDAVSSRDKKKHRTEVEEVVPPTGRVDVFQNQLRGQKKKGGASSQSEGVSPTKVAHSTQGEVSPAVMGKVSPYHLAVSEPVVREILDKFEGRLVDIRPARKK